MPGKRRDSLLRSYTKLPDAGPLRETMICETKSVARRFRSCPILRKVSERSGTGEFNQFLSTAKGSAGEVRSQLYVALDQEYISLPVFESLMLQATEISRMIGGLMTYLRTSGIKGTKFKKAKTT